MKARTGPASCSATRAALAVVFALAWTLPPAAASVVKCTDVDGNITYQDTPCERGQAGRAVALPPAGARDDATSWEAAAKDARVIKGMPKRWVLRARGAPAEIRPASVREGASEVWRYAGRDGMTLVGFAGSDVTWVREDASGKEIESRIAAPTSEVAARGAQNRRFVIAGRYCEHVFAEIGTPDRQEPLDTNPANARNMRNTYEPQPGDPQMRTVFTCIAGKVIDVERTVVR